MSNHEYHQRYIEAMKKLAGSVEHKNWCAHWKGGACSCDTDDSVEDVPLHEREI